MTNQEIGYSVELLRYGPNQDEVAAAAFLARYGGRTLDAYRQDLKGYFTWAGSVRGHEKVPTGGHVRSPLVATKSPHWWPGEVPTPH